MRGGSADGQPKDTEVWTVIQFLGNPLTAGGLLISHIYSREDKKSANDTEVQKTVDIECADGLWGRTGGENPYTGRDDLDFWAHDDEYMISHNGNLGDETDVFDGIRYTSFTPYTNPNTNAYGGPSRMQKKGTHIAVINIHPDPADPTVMVADFILNYSSGQIKKDVRGPTAVKSRTWGQIKNMFK